MIGGGVVLDGGLAAEFLLLPAAGRLAIGPPYELRIDGAAEYAAAPMGHWTRREIPVDRWPRHDVRLGLKLCAEACLEEDDGTITFDRESAVALMAGGLHECWTMLEGEAVVDLFGHLREIAFRFGDGSTTHETRWSLRWFDVPASIEIPPEKLVIGPEDQVWEWHHRHG